MEIQTNRAEMSKSEATLWFWSVTGFFAAVWILLPTLLHTGYRGDVIELQDIAPQWVLATHRHPMLPAWLLEIMNILTWRSFAAPFIASQFCTLLALWSVWSLSRTVLCERLALIATFSVLPYLFFTCKPVWYNQNNTLIAFWALTIYLAFQAFQTDKKRYWIGTGIALGLTFHAKYSAVFLGISMFVYMLTRAEVRKHFRTVGPWLASMTTFMVILPHVIWLLYHGHDPLTQVSARSDIAQLGWISPLYFAGSQTLYWLTIVGVFIPIIGFTWQWKIRHHEHGKISECEKFLYYCFMIPFAFHLLYSGLKGTGLRMEYGAAFWTFGGLWLLLRFQQTKTLLQSFRYVNALVITTMMLLIVGFVILFYSGQQHPDLYKPTRELGVVCDRLWAKYSSPNCPYITGTPRKLIGHTAWAMSASPTVIVPYGTWANDDDLNKKGGMIVWERENDVSSIPEDMCQRFPTAKVIPEAPEFSYKVGSKTRVLKIGIAIVSPQLP